MSIIDRVGEHFESLGGGRIEVPEWGEGDAPQVVTWKQMSLREHSRLHRKAGTDNFKLACNAIARNALDGDGKRLFEDGDELRLIRKADPAVILRVAAAMLDLPTSEDLEKN